MLEALRRKASSMVKVVRTCQNDCLTNAYDKRIRRVEVSDPAQLSLPSGPDIWVGDVQVVASALIEACCEHELAKVRFCTRAEFWSRF